MRKHTLAALALAVLATTVTAKEPSLPGDDWPRAKPEERGLEAARLAALTRDSGGVILMHADAYAERHLFEPLGITRSRWDRNDEGHPHTGGGLHLRPRDMAKLGLLYLRGGRWGDRQVVPAEWVETSVERHLERRRGHDVGYGYLWWILEGDPHGAGKEDIWAAKGFMGQYVFVVPEHDLVVAVTAGAHGMDQIAPISFLYSHVLPAVRKSAP